MGKTGLAVTSLLNPQSESMSGFHFDEGKWFSVQQLQLEHIRSSSKNEYGMREISKLAASIAIIGLLHNIVVREIKKDSYELVSGERRYHACKMLYEEGDQRFATIPCKIELKMDDVFAEFLLLQANSTSRELTDYELAYQGMRIKQILKCMKASGQLNESQAKGLILKGRTREAIADMLNVSSSQVSRWESIFSNLIPSFIQEFKAGNIGISMAYDLSMMTTDEQEAARKVYSEDGQNAIRDITSKPSAMLKSHSFAQTIDSISKIDETVKFVPPSTAINVQKQNRQKEITANDPSRSPVKPLIGIDAQYQSLLELGIEAKVNLSYTTKPADKAKYAERLEAFGMVADEFGFGRKVYLDNVEKLLLIEGKSLAK